MNDADRKAFEAACNALYAWGYSEEFSRALWQTALEYARSQVGEPAGWIQFIDGKQTQNFCRDKQEMQTIDNLSRLMNKNSDISYQPVFCYSHDSPSAQKAWGHGYKSGVEDERTSEANIGIAGLGGKINTARENPYRNKFAQPTAQINQQLTALLEKSLHWLDGLCDAGPLGQQYPTDELTQFVENIRATLAATQMRGDA